jgi:hypothetical protein
MRALSQKSPVKYIAPGTSASGLGTFDAGLNPTRAEVPVVSINTVLEPELWAAPDDALSKTPPAGGLERLSVVISVGSLKIRFRKRAYNAGECCASAALCSRVAINFRTDARDDMR